MKLHTFNLRFLPLFLGVIVLLTSCIKEDLSKCNIPIEMLVRFEYLLNNQSKDLFAEKVNHLDLLIYDSEHKLVNQYHELQLNMLDGNLLPITLLPDETYTFVVWANTTKEQYVRNYTDKLEDLRVQVKPYESKPAQRSASYTVNPSIESLFHGIKQLKVVSDEEDKQSLQPTISLTNNTNKVHIIVEELGSSKPINIQKYSVEISGSNGTYDFENTPVGTDLLNYKPTYTYPQKHSMQVDFNVLRLLEGGDLAVKVYDDQKKTIYDKNLVNLLLQKPDLNTNLDLDRNSEYTLRFQIEVIDKAPVLTLISIDDWELNEQNSGI